MTPGTDPTAVRHEDARDLQVRLYREIGIAAVAAALRFTTRPEPTPRAADGLDRPAEKAEATRARAA